MVAILALISSILFTPAFTISYFYETGVVIKANGQVISCHALPMKTGYGSDVISQYEDVYGS